MKHIFFTGMAALVAAAGLFFAACANPFTDTPKNAAPLAEGEGAVTINLGGKDGRSVVSELSAYFYELYFAPGTGNSAPAKTVTADRQSSVTVTLDSGAWSLRVRGYIDEAHYTADADDYGLEGTAPLTVTAGQSSTVSVPLSAYIVYATSGKLRYRVSFPEEVIKAEIRFSGFLSTETWEAETVNLLSGSANSGGSRLAQGTVNLYSGYYRISLELSMIRDGIYQRVFKTKIVKIMSSLPSELDETFTVDGFSHVTKFSALADVSAFLAGSTQNDADTPYEIKLVNMSFDQLGSMTTTPLTLLYESFNGRYVSADLSGVTGDSMVNPSYLPGYTLTSDQTKYLVEVILPDTLKTIGKAAFRMVQVSGEDVRYHSSLRAVTLPTGLEVIDEGAFTGCEMLEMPEWPVSLKKIGGSAFANCFAMTGELVLPASVTFLGRAVFGGTAITKADLSALTGFTGTNVNGADNVMQNQVFSGCQSLVEAILPANIKIIFDDMFRNCVSLETVNLDELTSLETLSEAFLNVSTITDVTISSTVLKTFAWDGTGLETLDLSACTGLTTVPAVWNLPTLTSLTLPAASALTGVTAPYYVITNSSSTDLLPAPATSLATVSGGGGKLRVEAAGSGKMIIAEYGTSTITKNLVWARSATGAITIPADITRIEVGAFMGSGITSVTAAENAALTAIGNYAFYQCENLVTVDLSACTSTSLAALGTAAFAACTSLTDVSLPPHLAEINARAFQNDTALVSMEIPISASRSQFSFRDYAFLGCTSLTGLTWNITHADPQIYMTASWIFKDCTALTNANFLPADKRINMNLNIFTGCTNLAALTLPAKLTTALLAYTGDLNALTVTVPAALPAGLFTITSFPAGSTFVFEPGGVHEVSGDFMMSGTTVLAYTGSSTGAVTLPAGTTGIGPGAFAGKSLTSIDLSGVTYIGAGAFANCASLAQLTLGAKLPRYNDYNKIGIYADAFTGCAALSAVTIPADQGEGVIEGTSTNPADFSTANFKTVIQSAIFKDSPGVVFTVTGTGRLSAASGGKALVYTKDAAGALIVAVNGTNYAVPAGVTEVDAGIFTRPDLLESLDLGACNNLNLTGNFRTNFTALAALTLPATVGDNTLPGYASAGSGNTGFQGMTSLTQVIIPSTLEAGKVLSYHFRDTNAVFSIQGSGGNYQVSSGMLISPDGKTILVGSRQEGTISIPAGIEEISDYAFAASLAQAVNFPASLKTIGEYAFEKAALQEADLSATGVTVIKRNAFAGCASLAQVRFPNTLETIYSYAFQETGLRTLTLPSSLQAIEAAPGINYNYIAAFQNCRQLEWVRWAAAPEGARIGAGSGNYTTAFQGCTNLVRVELPANLAMLSGRLIFGGCTSLTTVIVRAQTPPDAAGQVSNTNGLFGNPTTVNTGLKIYVPASALSLYQEAGNWTWYRERIVSIEENLPDTEDPALWQ